ncbi:MAG: hypothetical protein K2F57_07575, partial [Candidatus Gastranaerophilales bacterium]|nr:hypothetical protein [Candidatus Gastranaerophilales bacterium]
MIINKVSVNNYQHFAGHDSGNEMTRKQKAVVLASSAAGMTPVLVTLAKHKGFSLNPAKIIKTPVKDWAIFKYAPKEKSIQFEEAEIISVATGSIVGGFIGGTFVDHKSNRKAKQREILNQLLGNILVPVGCVGLGSRVYSKFAEQIENAMPQIKSFKKPAKIINAVLRKLPNAATTLGLLGVGIYLGNRVSNLINEKLYHKEVDRNIRPSDFAPHIDDVCMATSMMNKESAFGSKLGRVIPLALIVPGYETGIAQDLPAHKHT